MSKKRCSQCDKELPVTWSDSPNANWDPVCPECALRDLKKKSIRRRRVLDTSVRKKVDLKPTSSPERTEATPRASQRTAIPMDFELDTDDPLLLASHGESDQDEAGNAAEAEKQQKEEKAKKEEKVINVEETTQIRKPKQPPPGPQIRLNF